MSLQRRRGAIAGARSVAAGSPVTGDIASTLPALTQAAAGSVEVRADIAATLPALEQAATGTVTAAGSPVTGDIASTLPALTQAATGKSFPVTSGLVLLLDARQIAGLADNDAMASWNDLSGQGNDFTQSTPANRPRYRTNRTPDGEPAVEFVRTNISTGYWFDAPAIWEVQSGTTFIMSYAATANTMWTLSARTTNSSTRRWYVGLYASGDFYYQASADQVIDPYSTGVWERRVLRADGNSKEAFKNGTSVGTISNSTTGTSGGARLGAAYEDNANENPFDGDVACVIHFDRALSNAEITEVDDWLADNFGVSP